jgi:plasmid stability protein
MASLRVRHLDEDLVRRLRVRAAKHGRSIAAEHRVILEAALRPKVTGRELWDKLARGEKADLHLDEKMLTRNHQADLDCLTMY